MCGCSCPRNSGRALAALVPSVKPAPHHWSLSGTGWNWGRDNAIARAAGGRGGRGQTRQPRAADEDDIGLADHVDEVEAAAPVLDKLGPCPEEAGVELAGAQVGEAEIDDVRLEAAHPGEEAGVGAI